MEKSYPEVDRRLFSRCIIEGSAVLAANNNPKEPVIVNDLCQRGAGLFCSHPMEVGEEVEIEINCFFDRIVRKKAKVIWCREVNSGLWRIGLDFGLADLVEFGKSS
ncbi:MAG: PilZ domain-containing protein [Candidatus Omnitrophota bacterium]